MQCEIFEDVTPWRDVLVNFTDPINVTLDTGCVQHNDVKKALCRSKCLHLCWNEHRREIDGIGAQSSSSLKIVCLEERYWRPNARFGSVSETWICGLTGLRATPNLKIAVFVSCDALCFDKYRSFVWNCCLCPQGRRSDTICPTFLAYFSFLKIGAGLWVRAVFCVTYFSSRIICHRFSRSVMRKLRYRRTPKSHTFWYHTAINNNMADARTHEAGATLAPPTLRKQAAVEK